MELKETFVSRQEIFHGRIVDLRVDTVRLPNGHLTTREVIDHPGGVAVVAIDENDNVLTVKQYRYAFQTVLEEIPAGKLERGEDPAAAARRELSEETGASCETLTPLGEILASPGGFTEVLHLYMATGLTFGSQHPDEDEFINFERVPFDALLDRCLSGRPPRRQDGRGRAEGLRPAHTQKGGEMSMEPKKTVLIVEDEVNIVDIVRFNLQREGYATLEAYDGEAGSRASRARKSPTSSCST